MPQIVQEATIEYLREMNTIPPYEKWGQWKNLRNQNKTELAEHLQVQADEISIVRNATEALSTIIFGLPLKKGDEIIVAEHDYPHVLLAFKQRKEREGIKIKKLNLNLTTATDTEIVNAYQNALSKDTKLVLLTHITHREGRILPIEKISTAIKSENVEIVLDAAHSFAQILFSIPSLGVDYLTTSLHKWLNAPHGTGLLYVPSDKMSKIYGLHSSEPRHLDSTEKYEYQGTRAFHQEIGISAALKFQDAIGWDRKYKRLQELKHYWTNAVKDVNNIRFGTPLLDQHSCAITSFCFTESKKKALFQLKEKYGIHAKSVNINKQSHIRITPNIFTLEKDLDLLIDAIHQIAKT